MSAPALDLRLMRPSGDSSLAALMTAWRHDDIEIDIAGMAAFARAPSLLNKLRGSLGHQLLAAASPGVKRRSGCDWRATSAAEYLFGRRPVVRLCGHDSEIAKPFVLQADVIGIDLRLRIRLFGIACEIAAAVREAAVIAVRERMAWDALSRDVGARAGLQPLIADVRVTSVGSVMAVPPTAGLVVTFLTPLDRSRGWETGLESAPRRLGLLAPWFGVAPQVLDAIAPVLSAASTARKTDPVLAHVERGGHGMREVLSVPPERLFENPSSALRVILPLLEFAHVGRGATVGLGRVSLSV